MQNKIGQLRQDNLAKRKKKLEKIEKNKIEIENKHNLKLKENEVFSNNFIKEREKRQKKYLLRYEKQYMDSIKKLKSKKRTFNQSYEKSLISKRKINQRIAYLENLIKKTKNELKIKSYKDRINNIKSLEISETPFREEKLNFYKYKINSISKNIENKIKKVKYKEKIAKLTEEQAYQKIEKLRIDEGVLLLRWENKINYIKSRTALNKVEEKISKLNTIYENKKKTVSKILSSPSTTNPIYSIKSRYNELKSKYFLNIKVDTIFGKIKSHLKKNSIYYILASIILYFFTQTSGDILNGQNIVSVFQNNIHIFIMGIGMLLVIVSGYIDLSVGGMMAFMGGFAAYIFNNYHNLAAAIILTLIVGASYGAIQGISVGLFKIPSFIVTLASMLIFQGLIMWVIPDSTIVINGSFNSDLAKFVTGSIVDSNIGNGNEHFWIATFLILLFSGIVIVLIQLISRIRKIAYGIQVSSTLNFIIQSLIILGLFTFLGFKIAQSIFGLQYYMIYLIIIIVLFLFITQNTVLGRKIYAIGGNKKAAELSGVSVPRTTIYVFTIMGFLASFAGIVFIGLVGSASSQTASNGIELDVISSVFVGGASMTGGIGTVAGTLIGGFILGFMNFGMSLLSITYQTRKIVKGVVLFLAVGYDVFSNRKIG